MINQLNSSIDNKGKDYICVVGGASIDIYGIPFDKLKINDSTTGRTGTILGGVGRNISENLSKLKLPVKLITAFGGDVYAQQIKENCHKNNVSLEFSTTYPQRHTPNYLYIMDETGEMQYAIADMQLNDYITVEYIKERINVINGAKACIIETNLQEDTIEYIIKNSKAPVFLDPVSVKKAEKVKNHLKGVHTIKANRLEAEYLTSTNINTKEDVKIASKTLVDMGVENVFISLGQYGLHYRNKSEYGFIPSFKVNVVDTTGAGDSLMAGIVFGFINNYHIQKSAEIAVAVSSLTVESQFTVAQNLCPKEVYDRLKEIEE